MGLCWGSGDFSALDAPKALKIYVSNGFGVTVFRAKQWPFWVELGFQVLVP